jgi:hypothetical protein
MESAAAPAAAPSTTPTSSGYPTPGVIPEPPSSSGRASRFSAKIIVIVAVIFLLFLIGAGGLVYGGLGRPIAYFVQSLPFAPKTPKFLLERAVLAHQKVTKFAFDLSLAVDADMLKSFLGSNHVDFQIKGAMDYSNKTNIKSAGTIALGTDLNVEVRQAGAKAYVKANQLPATLLSSFKIKPVLDNWVVLESSSLPTAARQEMQKTESEKENANFAQLIDDDYLINRLVLSQETLDSRKAYRLKLDLTPEVLDYFDRRLQLQNGGAIQEYKRSKTSDFLKDATASVWIDAQTYYVCKASLAFKFLPDGWGLSNQTTQVLGANTFSPVTAAAVLKLTDYGKDFAVVIPEKVMTTQELLAALATPDQQRQSDLASLQSAVVKCAGNKKLYVAKLDDLIACKALDRVPVDPTTGLPYEYRACTMRNCYQLRAKLSNGQYITLTDKTPIPK